MGHTRNSKPRPIDVRRPNDNLILSVAEKNEEVKWVLEQYRRLYSNFRLADQTSGSPNAKASDTAVFNKCQFLLEYALGLTMSDVRVHVAREVRWITPEGEQLRARALGEFS